METLKKLTPAETLLIRDGIQVSFRDLLKYTLTDLVLKKVIKVVKEETPDEADQQELIHQNVEIGPNFHTYQPKYHEEIYLQPFKKSPELQIQLKHLIKMGWENAKNKGRYIFREVMVSAEIKNCFKEGWFYRVFHYPSYTDEGKEKKRIIDAELARLDETLPHLMDNDPEGVKKLIDHIHGNILLVKSFDRERLKELDKAFHQESADYTMWGDMDTAAIFFLFLFNDYSTSFDSEYNSFTESSSWSGGGGCSSDGGGDGGCSGCSGCGGCGGCGG